MISSQNYAGSKQKPFKIITIQMFAIHDEVQRGPYKRLKLGGGQAYDRSSEYPAVNT
jgi:hypothetical protein